MFLFLESLSLSRFTSFFYFTSFVSDTLAAAFGCIYTFVMRINWSEKKSTMGETREGEEEGKENRESEARRQAKSAVWIFAGLISRREDGEDRWERETFCILVDGRQDGCLAAGVGRSFCVLSPFSSASNCLFMNKRSKFILSTTIWLPHSLASALMDLGPGWCLDCSFIFALGPSAQLLEEGESSSCLSVCFNCLMWLIHRARPVRVYWPMAVGGKERTEKWPFD